MSVYRSKKCRNVYKANKVGNTPNNFFVLSQVIISEILILHHLFKHKESKTCTFEVLTGTESYFENFLHLI